MTVSSTTTSSTLIRSPCECSDVFIELANGKRIKLDATDVGIEMNNNFPNIRDFGEIDMNFTERPTTVIIKVKGTNKHTWKDFIK